jgi:hypothetical protein
MLKVVPLTKPTQLTKPTGRPKKRVFPAIPVEITGNMSELEVEHFNYFIETIKEENPDLSPADMIALHMAAMEYINALRLEVIQLRDKELVTMSRQHPAVQCRAWLDLLSVTRKQRQGGKSAEAEERAQTRSALLGLSSR